MNIQGKTVTLRAPELDDVPRLHRWSNDPEVWNMLGGWHFPFSSRSTEDWVRSRKDGNPTSHVFCIDTPDDGISAPPTWWTSTGKTATLSTA